MKGKAILTVGAVMLKKDKVLLVRHTSKAEHLTDTYGIPAGRVGKNENILQACVREVKEETGLEVVPEHLQRLPNAYCAEIERKDGNKLFVLIPYYTNKFNGKLSPNEENEPLWVDIGKLDTVNLLPNQKEVINKAKKYLR